MIIPDRPFPASSQILTPEFSESARQSGICGTFRSVDFFRNILVTPRKEPLVLELLIGSMCFLRASRWN